MAEKKAPKKKAPSVKPKVPEPSKFKHRLMVLLPWVLAIFFGIWALYPTVQEEIVKPTQKLAQELVETKEQTPENSQASRAEQPIQKREYLDFHDRLKSQQVEVDVEELNQNFDPEQQYVLQVGAFGKREVAEREKARFALQGYSVWMERSGRYYILKSGPYTGKREARKYRSRFRKMGADVMTLEYKAAEKPAQIAKPSKKEVSQPKPVVNQNYRLQIASFTSLDDAEKLRAELILKGIETQILAAKVNSKSVFRLQTPSMSQEQARKLQKSLRNQQIDTLFVRD